MADDFTTALGVNDLHKFMLTGSGPCHQPDRQCFMLGDTTVDPSTRHVSGPGGSQSIEPRVMQVLLELVRARGHVVTRDELNASCWGGTIVGEDALNRTIGAIRKVARTVACDGFDVETISRTGYRLSGIDFDSVDRLVDPVRQEISAHSHSTPAAFLSRRMFVGSGLAGAALAAIGGVQVWQNSNSGRIADLLSNAQHAFQQDLPNSGLEGLDLLNQALALQPDLADTLGRLAVAWANISEDVEPGAKAEAVRNTQDFARRALIVEPRQPDALAALALLQPEFGDWLAAEKRYRHVLAIDPLNESALNALATVLQGVGRSRASSEIIMPLSDRFPLAPKYRFRKTFSLWSTGRLEDAERNIDNAIEIWPRHPSLWFAKFWLYAMTDRTSVSMAMLDDLDDRPDSITPEGAIGLRLSLTALLTRKPGDVRAAVDRNLSAVKQGPSYAIYAIMILSQLGELDTAFSVAEGYLLRRGDWIGPLRQAAGQPALRDEHHRKTLMLFIPATRPLRADPRFLLLCKRMGMTRYWQETGFGPDYLKQNA